MQGGIEARQAVKARGGAPLVWRYRDGVQVLGVTQDGCGQEAGAGAEPVALAAVESR